MRVLYTASGIVDFERPIHLREDQSEEFGNFLSKLLGKDVVWQEVTEPERAGFSTDAERRPWTPADLAELLVHPEMSHSELAALLDRSDMSITMKRGDFPSTFRAWLKDQGVSLPADRATLEDLISRFQVGE